RVGIVGPTGAGKTSLVNALLRFWEYEGGSIRVTRSDGRGVELRDMHGDDARRLFSVMPQVPHLFHASLRENLALATGSPLRSEGQRRSPPPCIAGLPEAAHFVSDAELLRALDDAQLGDLVASLPDGLDTTVGETGRELSAGEARRVAFARALLKEAPFVILDEPTEALDEETAERMLESVSARLAGRTLIIITHRQRDLSIVEEVVRLSL
ncbi:MAG TPA: ATP-binding cassette domain-containing protein, partial [Spirochaetia bacterium]